MPTWSCFARRRAELAPAGRVRELATSFRAHRELLRRCGIAFAGGLFGADYRAAAAGELGTARGRGRSRARRAAVPRRPGGVPSEPGRRRAARGDPRHREGPGCRVGPRSTLGTRCRGTPCGGSPRRGCSRSGSASCVDAGTLARGHRGAGARDRGHGGLRARARRRGRADVPDRRARLLVAAPGRRPHRLPRGAREPARRPAPVRGARLAPRRRVERHAGDARGRRQVRDSRVGPARGRGADPGPAPERGRAAARVRRRCSGAPRAHGPPAARRPDRARHRRHPLRPRRAPAPRRRAAPRQRAQAAAPGARVRGAGGARPARRSSISSRRWRARSSAGPRGRGAGRERGPGGGADHDHPPRQGAGVPGRLRRGHGPRAVHRRARPAARRSRRAHRAEAARRTATAGARRFDWQRIKDEQQAEADARGAPPVLRRDDARAGAPDPQRRAGPAPAEQAGPARAARVDRAARWSATALERLPPEEPVDSRRPRRACAACSTPRPRSASC